MFQIRVIICQSSLVLKFLKNFYSSMPFGPMMLFLCLTTRCPWSPFTNVSNCICILVVALCIIPHILLLCNLSVMKKYWIVVCFVHLVIDYCPFICNWIALVLSCSITIVFPCCFSLEFLGRYSACSWKKYFIHSKINAIQLCLQILPALLQLNFFLFFLLQWKQDNNAMS